MKENNSKKILVAIDGSESAMQTVRYLSGLRSMEKKEVVLFSVYESVPDYYWDLSSNPAYLHTSGSLSALSDINKKHQQEALESAKLILTRSGFLENRIIIKLQKRIKGIARDIIAESEKGYFLTIAGRKGMRRMERIVFGSVAAKLIEKTVSCSLLLVGRGASTGKLLVAVDGSEGSWRITDYIGRQLAEPGFEKITLLNVMRGQETPHNPEEAKLYPTEKIGNKMEEMLGNMRTVLCKSAVSPGSIDSCIIKNAFSRADAIISFARENGYESIAIGRKGHSSVNDFSMGRVSSKVVQLSKGLAVWIIS